MSKRRGKHLRQRTTLFVFATLGPLLLSECSLILNDLPEPVDSAPNSTGGSGGSGGKGSTNQGGKSSAGGTISASAGAENTGGVVTATGGVGAGGMHLPAGGESGNNATGGSSGDTSSAEGGSGGSGCPCDCDKDGSLNDQPGCHSGGGPADCDDSDANVKPSQTMFFDELSNGGTFDYNCNDDIEQEERELGTCPGLVLGECSPEEGYLSWPQCGEPGQWAQCKKSGLSCQPFVQYDRVLRCR